MFTPNVFLLLYQVFAIAFSILIFVTAVKLLLVLFKADKAIDEIRAYIRAKS